MNEFSIANHKIGPGHPALLVAEVGQVHDGSLGTAHAFIDLIARSGADAVKFQTHIAEAESSLQEPWRVPFSPQDASRYDYWKRTEFSETQWRGLKSHAEDAGLLFLSSPFSLPAVDLLERLDVPAWKIASGEVLNPLLLERIAQNGRPVLLSTGLCTDAELNQAVELFCTRHVSLAILQCTSNYPCAPEQWGLPRMAALRERYGVPVGLSDHSGTIYAGLAAVTLGANVLEVHVTMSRHMFGPDVAASITGRQLKKLAAGCRAIERALRGEPCQGPSQDQVCSLRRIFGKSLVAAQRLPSGTVLRREHIDARKPATGLHASKLYSVVGRRLARDIAAGDQFTESHFVPAGIRRG